MTGGGSEPETVDTAAAGRVQLLVAIADAMTGLTRETRLLRDDVRAVRRWRRLEILLLALVTVALVLFGWDVVAQRHTQQQNHRILLTIEDATNPGGKRYEQGQAQTATAVAAIETGTVKIVEAAVTCALTNVDHPELVNPCVMKAVAAAATP